MHGQQWIKVTFREWGHPVGQYQGWSYQFVSGQVELEASKGSQYWRG